MQNLSPLYSNCKVDVEDLYSEIVENVGQLVKRVATLNFFIEQNIPYEIRQLLLECDRHINLISKILRLRTILFIQDKTSLPVLK